MTFEQIKSDIKNLALVVQAKSTNWKFKILNITRKHDENKISL
jgi:hypothetical protein